MSRLIQISDTHFGTEQPAVVEALVAFVRGQAPDLVVLSGDITQRARSGQFRAACAFVERLEVPVSLAIPGNHDIPLFNPAARLLAPYANYRRAFGHNLEPEFESEALLVLCLNTTRPYRHKDGEVSAAQIERVAHRLERAGARQLRIVVTHQPVHVIHARDQSNLLHGHAAAVRCWAAAGADLILGGHIHLAYVRALHESVTGLARRVWAVQAGTAVSSRVRGGTPNSVNVINYDAAQSPRHCTVERWDHAVATQGFQCVAREVLQCTG